MKRRHILLVILAALVWHLLMLFVAGLVYRAIAIPGSAMPSGGSMSDTISLFSGAARVLNAGFMMLASMAVLMMLLGVSAAIYVFPPAALALAIFLVFRRRRFSWKALRPPVILLLISLVCNFAWSLFVNGSGYVFHHDLGSKVYNEGYIIPHYEDKYGDELELVDKNVIDSCNAVYTLRSGKTGMTFTAETRYFSENAGSFDMLHLSASYQEILGQRLQDGEKISLPFGDGTNLKLEDGSHCWFYLSKTPDGYNIYLNGDVKPMDQEFQEKTAGRRFTIYLEGNRLMIEIPLLNGSTVVHSISFNPDTPLSQTRTPSSDALFSQSEAFRWCCRSRRPGSYPCREILYN